MSVIFNQHTAFHDYIRPGGKMDAIIGRYRVLTEETGLTLTHPTGMSFTLTLTEALELMDFIRIHQPTISAVLDATKSDDETHVADE